jgi:hypothetical protein
LYFEFGTHVLDKKTYIWTLQRLCDISEEVYFFSDDVELYNDRVYELCEKCTKTKLPKEMVDRYTTETSTILGFKVDIHIKKFIYEYDSIFQFLGGRGSGGVLFCKNQKEIAAVILDDFDDILIETTDEDIIERLSKIKWY